MTRSYLRSNKHKMMLINLTTNFSALKKCLLSIVCLCQARAMATARGTGTARPPPPPPSPARPPPPCPCRQGATQGRPAPSTCTPSGTSAHGSGPRPTPSTRRTTRWDFFCRFLLRMLPHLFRCTSISCIYCVKSVGGWKFNFFCIFVFLGFKDQRSLFVSKILKRQSLTHWPKVGIELPGQLKLLMNV